MAKQMTFGVIVGNRGFFPDHLAKTGREEILRVLGGGWYSHHRADARRTQSSARSRRLPKRVCAAICSASTATRSMG